MENVEGIDIQGICDRLSDDEEVFIRQSTVVFVIPQSKSKDNVECVHDESVEYVEAPYVGMLFSSWEDAEAE